MSFDDHKVNRPGLEESFVLKINQDTSIGGAIVSDGAPIDYNFKIAHQSHIDEAGNIYTIGNFNKLIVFGCDTLLSGGDEMFITKYTEVPPVYNIFIDGPKTLCDGSPLKLSATPIPEPVKYFWMLPTGATATNASANQVNATVDYSSNGGEILVEIKKGCYRYQGRNLIKLIFCLSQSQSW